MHSPWAVEHFDRQQLYSTTEYPTVSVHVRLNLIVSAAAIAKLYDWFNAAALTYLELYIRLSSNLPIKSRWIVVGDRQLASNLFESPDTVGLMPLWGMGVGGCTEHMNVLKVRGVGVE